MFKAFSCSFVTWILADRVPANPLLRGFFPDPGQEKGAKRHPAGELPLVNGPSGLFLDAVHFLKLLMILWFQV